MEAERRHGMAGGWVVLLAIAVAGLFFVKWAPYWQRAFVAAANHSIGASMLTGGTDRPPAPSWDAAVGYAWAYGKAIWQAMVLGLVLGSGVQALLPPHWIVRWLGRANVGSVMGGAALALPGMMCSCCAAPVAMGMRRANASAGAAVAFWLGNPLLNPATLVFIGFVLGWRWAALRLGLGVVAVLGLGLAADRLGANHAAEPFPIVAPASETGPFMRWLTLLARMSVRLIPEYLVLVLLLGATRAWLFPHAGPEVGNGLGTILAVAVAGALFVIPTAGEVPVVGTMLSLGVGVGPAGALLMVLPALSLPSLAMVRGVFGDRLLGVALAGMVAIGVAGGLAAIALRF